MTTSAAKSTEPAISILNPAFAYRGPASTDVQQTWRRFGWKPLAERIIDQDQTGEGREGPQGPSTAHAPATRQLEDATK